MRGINYVCLSGHLGADPELRHTKSGSQVAELRLATNRKFKQEGELKEETEWTTVKAWAQRAEFAATYLHKGDPVIVQGRLHTEKWTNASGEPCSKITVIAHELTALPRPDWRDRSDTSEAPAAPPQAVAQEIPF